MPVYIPAEKPTMYFIGVTTTKSSIMKVFPKWMEYFGIDADLKGIDFAPHSAPSAYHGSATSNRRQWGVIF